MFERAPRVLQDPGPSFHHCHAWSAGLDEPFLLVVVGEFNSGKSSVVNALLGAPFLEEGILPTTNEISILKHSAGEESSVERVRRQRAPCL